VDGDSERSLHFSRKFHVTASTTRTRTRTAMAGGDAGGQSRRRKRRMKPRGQKRLRRVIPLSCSKHAGHCVQASQVVVVKKQIVVLLILRNHEMSTRKIEGIARLERMKYG
jgi:hypothetical protein